MELYLKMFSYCPDLLSYLHHILRSRKRVSLLLACLLCFFASGANSTFEIYFPNYLAEGVYQGSGEAPQLDESKQRYDNGMKTAAIGTLVFQAVFFIYNVFHQKISSETGLVYEFIIVSFFMVPSLLVLVLTQSLAAFYVTVVVNGAYRTLVFTTPFILAAETTRMVTTTFLSQGDPDDDIMDLLFRAWAPCCPSAFYFHLASWAHYWSDTEKPASPMYYGGYYSYVLLWFLLFIVIVSRRRSQRLT
ncbi:hypothetical protein Btru_034668 [Bulinus truncatus]|nr:hypothetical protein Btru_034668 [Bulinus truncatus]